MKDTAELTSKSVRAGSLKKTDVDQIDDALESLLRVYKEITTTTDANLNARGKKPAVDHIVIKASLPT
jgi:hypothetical protein